MQPELQPVGPVHSSGSPGDAAVVQSQRIVLGHVVGVFGLQGWVKVHSDTDPREGILRYREWLLGPLAAPRRVISGRRQGKSVIAHLDGCVDRDQAEALIGWEIAICRSQLPPPSRDEYYWIDLEGLAVETTTGLALGQVSHLFATAANDVLVVRGEREHLLPFVGAVVQDVDFTARRILVDWDPEF